MSKAKALLAHLKEKMSSLRKSTSRETIKVLSDDEIRDLESMAVMDLESEDEN